MFLSLIVFPPVFKRKILYIANSKNLHLFHDYHRSILFMQCFIICCTSRNVMFFTIFSGFFCLFVLFTCCFLLCFLFTKCRGKISSLACHKTSIFHLLYFPGYWTILWDMILFCLLSKSPNVKSAFGRTKINIFGNYKRLLLKMIYF